MTTVFCAPPDLIPLQRLDSIVYFSMYKHEGLPDVSTIGTSLIDELRRDGIQASNASWDFLTLALAVNAADHAVLRSRSADGWTRTIDLHVVLYEPAPFQGLATEIQQALRFLTGDFWTITFLSGGYPPPIPKNRSVNKHANCVSLLSGGLDSLIGAIDLRAKGLKPLLVSHMAKGDSPTQRLYAKTLSAADFHTQWNQNVWIKPKRSGEDSTRARSIVFFAFAAVVADNRSTAVGDGPIDVYVPENGLISLNVPLNPGRVGSLSTKTTHPIFMERLQSIWTKLGIPVHLLLPYAYMTKGEMMSACLDQTALTTFAGSSTSCGRYAVNGLQHCGRCVPCMVRRAAFVRSGIADTTKSYVNHDLRTGQTASGANDVAAVGAAVCKVKQNGIRSFTAGQFAFANPARRSEYEGVVERGLDELATLLKMYNLL